jgi:uncharacterized protein YecE (DUF72 family)
MKPSTSKHTANRGRLRIGTSSFSEADWVGPFYPAGTRPAGYLRYYATRFNTVEIDASYYAIPRRQTVDNWAKNTPDGFLFAAKFPHSIVHGGEGPRPDPGVILMPEKTYGERDKFLEVMSGLGSRLGPLVLQFPYFSKAVFRSSADFTDRLGRFLDDLPSGFRYAVEIRNRAWLTPKFADLLRNHRVALVLVDQGWMPHGDEVAEMFNPVTADFAYLRLLGDRKEIEAVTDRWNKVVIDRSDRLKRWATLVTKFLMEEVETMVYANNHYAGFAPDTVKQLQAMIDNIASLS